MNIFRLIAIALPMTILIACGGGSGGGTAAAPNTPPTTMMPGTDDPNMPPGTDDPNMLPNLNMVLSPLSNFESSTGHASIQAVSGIVANATLSLSNAYQSGSLQGQGFPTCFMRVNACFVGLPGVSDQFLSFFSRRNPEDISLIGKNDYFNNDTYTSTSTSSVTANGATLARGNLMGTRAADSSPLEVQSFAGWLNGSVFGTTQITVGESGSEQYRFVSYLAGVPNTSNPVSTGSATWEGAAVGSIKADRTFILGEATITVNFTDTNVDLMFDNWRGLDNQVVSGMSAITYNDLMLTNGAFEGSGNEQVQGRFYGTGHTEVGGFFNTMTVTGAFGATRQ